DARQRREGSGEEGPIAARTRFEPRPAGRMHFPLASGPEGDAVRLPLPAQDATFASDGLQLRGGLVLPAGGSQDPVPVAVLVHGSERYSALESNPMQIGRASCRERVSIWCVSVSLNKQ